MRSLRRRGNGRWRDVVNRRVRLTENNYRRPANAPMNGLMLLGEQVNDATSE